MNEMAGGPFGYGSRICPTCFAHLEFGEDGLPLPHTCEEKQPEGAWAWILRILFG